MACKSRLPSLLFFLFLSLLNPSKQQSTSPFVLDPTSFIKIVETPYGSATVSPGFSQLSTILRGINNYVLGTMDLNPGTFASPHHIDAEQVMYVISGRGVIHVMQEQKKEIYTLQPGDVLWIPAGSMHYFINSDEKNILKTAFLFIPVSIPGEFSPYTGAGGKDPESFLGSFSDDLMEAAYNTTRDKFDGVFRKQTLGAFVGASKKQIEALSRYASSSSKRGPYNLWNKPPTHSNKYGQLYEVFAYQYRQLQHSNAAVTFHNITKGAMVVPFYSSYATSMYFVTGGTGRVELISPRPPGSNTTYERVSAQLSPGSAVIVLAGRPVTFIAADGQDLQLIAFKVNAKNSQTYYFAGKDNLLNKLEREANELSFNVSATEVDAILSSQRYSIFVPGPSQRQ